MFNKVKTVDSILTTFNKVLDDLKEVEQARRVEEQELLDRLNDVTIEKTRAKKVIDNISKVIDV